MGQGWVPSFKLLTNKTNPDHNWLSNDIVIPLCRDPVAGRLSNNFKPYFTAELQLAHDFSWRFQNNQESWDAFWLIPTLKLNYARLDIIHEGAVDCSGI